MDPTVAKHLLNVLKTPESSAEHATKASIAAMRQKQSSILKVLSNQIEQLGKEYIDLLRKEGILSDLITYLYQDIENVGSSQASQKNQVLPLKWLEAKIQRIRKMAIESNRSLSLQQDDIKAYLLDEKELLFKRTDPRTQDVVRTNAYLTAAFNLHKVAPDAVYQCCMSNELNIGSDAGDHAKQVMKHGLVIMGYEELVKLEPRTLSILNSSEAILSTQPGDAKIEELFKRIVTIYKEDAEKPKKKRQGYENLLETVVFFVDQEDYPSWTQPIQASEEKDQIPSTSATEGNGPLAKLLKDLKEWGGLDEDEALFNLNPAEVNDLGAVMTLIQEGIIERQKQEEKHKEALKGAR